MNGRLVVLEATQNRAVSRRSRSRDSSENEFGGDVGSRQHC